jgi:predicted AlkP superfamily phosphohydrolase/phosphomutase
MQQGSYGPLASTIHPVTTPAWISFLTGRNQGQHGVFDHVQRRPGGYDLEIMDATKIRSPLMFDYVGKRGRKSISINVPLTYPPRPIEGLMVSGLFGTIVGPGITSPKSIHRRIAQVAPNYVVHPDFNPRAQNPAGQFLADLLQSVDDRFTVTETLLAENPWDFAIVVFTATDQAQHAFWHAMEDTSSQTAEYRTAIYDVYKRIDDNLSRLLSMADEETLVVIMSDHGAGRLHAIVNLNRWLADEGFLSFVDSGGAELRSNSIGRAAAAYKQYLPVGLKSWVRRAMPGQFKQAKEKMESQLFSSAIDWDKTTVYALGACGSLYMNLQGREPSGAVSPGAEYDRTWEEVARRLLAWRAPDGKLLVKEVLRPHEVYSGQYLDRAPDLIIVWHDYGYWGRARYDQYELELFDANFSWDFSTLPVSGTHRPNGILIASGPGVRANVETGEAKLIDLAPTMLAFLGQPIPKGLDGRVLEELFLPEFLDVSFIDEDDDNSQDAEFAYSSEEEAEVKRHLEDLGYL